MEYPMLVTAGATSMLGTGDSLIRAGADRSLEAVIAHEIGHQWWQSVVAFNEAEEPWLDEGFTDYSTLRVMERTYGANSSVIDTRSLDIGYLDVQRLSYAVDPRLPMARPAWEFDAVEYGIAVYTKPLLSLRTLERTLGEPVILDIMSTFFQRYRFAHPNTENFRAVAEEVAGQNLDWFFDGLVYGDGVLNYAVTEVDTHSVTAVRQGELAIPTEILVTFADGSTAIELWSGQEERVTLTYPDRPPVASASIDPEHKIALDLRWADNGLSREFRFSTWAALVSRLVHSLQSGLLLLGGL